MELRFLGAGREVGRSALLLDDTIMLDYGIKMSEPPQYPINGTRPQVILLSHCHIDHSGLIPNLMDLDPEIFMTPPTFDLTNLLLRDSLKIAESTGLNAPYDSGDIQKFMYKTKKVDYRVKFQTHGYNVEFYDAGHIPGAACIHVTSKTGESLLYTGDINTSGTRLVPGALEFPKADYLVIESTYFSKEHTPRKETEAAFIESLKSTLDIGGNVIIPAFAIGRTQEILMLLEAHGIRPYVDGMGTDAYEIMIKHPSYLRNPTQLKKAFDNAIRVNSSKRDNVPMESSVIVTTSGMLNGGPVMYYLNKLYKDPKSKMMLTGYQIEGTNGRMALDTGIIENNGILQQLKLKIEHYDFSAHAGDRELKAIVKDFCDRGTKVVFTMHGDNTQGFAAWIEEDIGVRAYAPANGEVFYLH
ncbi:MAG: MBL fold metallo-hydrolase [Methanomethylovorans sp.]|jgi:putative mRNA 3-end processing factor|nr:MBL fold metallo-hydrolase [Methanomethylovorans sp.]